MDKKKKNPKGKEKKNYEKETASESSLSHTQNFSGEKHLEI